MTQEAYCSFEIAKLLKEKGFDEPCNNFYPIKGGEVQELTWDELNYHRSQFIKAPTHQRALAWLREKDIIIVVQPEYFNAESKCSAWSCDIWCSDNYEKLQGDYLSYEEAVEAALKYSLENLV